MGKKGRVEPIEESSDMDMSPMIDMVFLLLIFFVVNATAITVKRDKNVEMPIASAAGEIKDAKGFVVITVWSDETRVAGAKQELVGRPAGVDASIMYGDENGQPIDGEQGLQDYVEKKVKEFKDDNGKPEELKLYLRGDQKALFKHSRRAIAVAGAAGIPNIVFGVVPPKK